MDGWKTATVWGFTFKYPAQWSVRVDPDTGEQGQYTNYQVIDGTGAPIAGFTPNSANDTDGDLGTYTYTDVDKTSSPHLKSKPTVVLFEHMDVDQPKGSEQYERSVARLSIRDVATLAQRGDKPSLPFFSARGQTVPSFSTVDAFFNKGMNPKTITPAQARDFTKTERYRAMKQIMLSVRPTNG